MIDKEFQLALGNILATQEGRLFILILLRNCGVSIGDGISYRSEKTAHELGLDLIHDIMYNHTESLKKLISDDKTLKEVENGRG